MVLTDESTLAARLIATWEARRIELRTRIAQAPRDGLSWMWVIQLRIFTFLIRRYGGDACPRPAAHDAEATCPVDAPPSADLAASTWRRPSAEELRLRALFHARCHETLARIRPLVADAQSRSASIGASEVRLMRDRLRDREAARRRPLYAAFSRRRFE